MQPNRVRVFAIALIVGWSAPNPAQPSLGLSAQARAKVHALKTKKQHHARPQKSAQKRVPIRAITKLPVAAVKVAGADEQSPSSSTLSPAISPNPTPPPSQPPTPTQDEHMEKLRIGLEKLARTMLPPEDYMERLRLGLEKRAREMNTGQT